MIMKKELLKVQQAVPRILLSVGYLPAIAALNYLNLSSK